MNPNLGASQLRNSQGNLFLKTDIVSKLLHLMNPIRRESKFGFMLRFVKREAVFGAR